MMVKGILFSLETSSSFLREVFLGLYLVSLDF